MGYVYSIDSLAFWGLVLGILGLVLSNISLRLSLLAEQKRNGRAREAGLQITQVSTYPRNSSQINILSSFMCTL